MAAILGERRGVSPPVKAPYRRAYAAPLANLSLLTPYTQRLVFHLVLAQEGAVVNLLAHALLSVSDVEVRLGNVLADFVKGRDRAAITPGFLAGVRQHQAIDAFTDSNPIVHRSRARISGYSHVTGILVDVFYDHFLTLHWDQYAPERLEVFTARVYTEFRSRPTPLPPNAQATLEQVIREDWLGSYGSIEGITDTLCRISERLEARVGRNLGIGEASSELIANFDDLERDFTEFFPLLQSRVGGGSRHEA